MQPLPAAGATAQGVAQHYEQGAQPVPQWWKRYGSPELDALVEEGLAKTRTWPPPAARWPRPEQLRGQINSSLMPSVDAGGGSRASAR